MSLVPEGTPGAVPVTVTALELLDVAAIVAARGQDGLAVREPVAGKADLSEVMYRAVGAPWQWVDRLGWSGAEWAAWTDRPEHRLLVVERDGAVQGYAELERQAEGEVEIAYFGLLPGAVGHGIGGWFLERVLRAAFEPAGIRRAWVHTCTLDHPAALPAYRARGMRECGTWTEWRLAAP